MPTAKLDRRCAEAVDLARQALVDSVPAGQVGEHLGVRPEGPKAVTHEFGCTAEGYRGWRWSVTVARAPKQKHVTVSEVVLLPGEDAVLAPEWVPYRERIQPGDLSPGDVLPPDEDDARLVPAYTASGEIVDKHAVKAVADELGLGRAQVLSAEGREQAAERWYEGEQGPESALAKSAPGTCSGCGFLLRLAGPLSQVFGVCANAFANDDGRVVSLDHGCGAHSEAALGKRQVMQPLPDPSYDTFRGAALDHF